MKDKDILNMLGLNDRTITLTADDEYLQIMLEKKIDNYLKKLDEEKKKEEKIDYYKNQYEKFLKKNEFVKNFDDKFVYGKLRDKLIKGECKIKCVSKKTYILFKYDKI